MSPLRRAWLAWGGRWEVVTVALIHFHVTAIPVAMALAIAAGKTVPNSHPIVLDQPFGGFYLLPFVLGWRLRDLLSNEGLALAQRHVAWHLRLFFLFILPVTVASIAIPLLLIGGSPAAALAIALCTCALGTWIGYARHAPQAFLGLFLYIMAFIWLRPGYSTAWDITACVVALGGCLLAWKRLLRHSWHTLSARPLATVIGDWLERMLGGSRPMPILATKRLPTLTTAARILVTHQRLWTFQVIGLLAMAIGSFFWTRDTSTHDSVAFAYGMVSVSACLIGMGWASPRRDADNLTSRTMVRGLLASERLRPLSRTTGAAAVLMGLIVRILNGELPIVGGLILGLAAADWSLGRTPDVVGLAILVPFALGVVAVVAAALILFHLIPPWIAVASGALLILGLFTGPILVLLNGWSDAYVALPAITIILALVLVPLAWHRLGSSELP